MSGIKLDENKQQIIDNVDVPRWKENPEKISEEAKEIPLFASGWGNYPAGLLEDVRKFYDTCPDVKMSVYVDGILAGSTWVRLEFITQLQ